MTRDEDEDLSSKYDKLKKRGDLYRRLLILKKYKPDLYISIHLNSSKNYSDNGIEILYNNINKNNKVLANTIVDNLKTKFNNIRNIKTTNLYMYKNTTVPGVLVECGFISNYKDRTNLLNKKYQEKFSDILTNSIIDYFK